MSTKDDFPFEVSLGSVQLGPLLLSLCITSPSTIISGHAISLHLYSDYSQLYVFFASGDSAAALKSLQSCLASVQLCILINKLKLNPDKLNSSL